MLGLLKKALESKVYGLDHAVLNVRLPPETMWMNMGYWEDTQNFPEACQALLDQVLQAGLSTETAQSVRVLDVGCGCGDQSVHIAKLKKEAFSYSTTATSQSGFGSSTGTSESVLQRKSNGNESFKSLVDNYVGITLLSSQAEIAQQRMRSYKEHNNDGNVRTSADVYCADGADPSSWTGELKDSISNMGDTSLDPDTSTWLLALDTMYHFQPSRLPILYYAQHTLHASFMAFDLLLADNTSWWQRLKMRLVCWVTGSPFTNFLTREEYIRLLVAAGYDPSRIEIKDISRHVFPGITDFLGRRIREGQLYGIKLGKFRGAKTVFGWWARSGIVRGVVVVARR
ncbi:uncharacterized protein N7496_012710 [Penicillium cataractarum]|uniref:Methyltransferase domain-containing protein n=1 Tax=Penicillium cataractarum TaxID=2100454 RepID=A0A9W9RDG0_9EURO|nr:uncharacterized protein N7496_012710 [Penicillium cataractarum]KAJ5355498.1 hypothetical protein N7496_012710 [Penicillium cataractarum]